MRGFIYKVVSPNTDKYYIGSTKRSLETRFSTHMCSYRKWMNGGSGWNSCYDIIQCGNPSIKLVEEIWCANIAEIRRKEGEYQKQYRDEIVNHRISGRTMKEWVRDNKDIVNKNRKRYYYDNQEKILENLRNKYVSKKGDEEPYRQKTRYADNREAILRRTALKNVTKRGKRPTALTIQKYNITEDEIAEALQKSQAE